MYQDNCNIHTNGRERGRVYLAVISSKSFFVDSHTKRLLRNKKKKPVIHVIMKSRILSLINYNRIYEYNIKILCYTTIHNNIMINNITK